MVHILTDYESEVISRGVIKRRDGDVEDQYR